MGTPPEYTVTELPSPENEPWPTAINKYGVVAGFLWDPTGYGSAVIWDAGNAKILQSIAGDSMAWGINDAGQVVGATPVYTGLPHAFLYPHPKPGPETKDLNQSLGGGQASTAFDINGNGVIVGWAGNGSIPGTPFIYHSSNNALTALKPLPGHSSGYASAVNEKGDVVGLCEGSAFGPHAFIYRNGTMSDLGGASAVTGLSNPGVMTGGRHAGKFRRAFRLDTSATHPAYELLGVSPAPGYTANYGLAINDAGAVVGVSWNSGGHKTFYRAFVDFPASSSTAGWWDLHDVVAGANDWVFEYATGINDKGQIVGSGRRQGKPSAFLLTPVPMKSPHDAIDEELLELVMLFGGVEAGGGGWGVTPAGKPVPIPPRQDFVAFWGRLPRQVREAMVGRAIRRLTLLIEEPRRRTLEKTVSDFIDGISGDVKRHG